MIILKLTGAFQIHVHFKMIILKREQMLWITRSIWSDETTIEYSKKLKNLFVFNYFQKTEVYFEPSQTSKMKPSVKIVNGLMPWTIFTRSSILYVWLVSKNATKSFNKSFCEFNFFSFSSHLVKYFFLLLYKFLFLPVFQNDLQVLLYKASIFIETNSYLKTYKTIMPGQDNRVW